MSATTVISTRDSTSDQSLESDLHTGLGVLVLDDAGWLRSRVCRLLEGEPGLRLAGVTGDAREAIRMAESEQVDVAVVGHRPRSRSAFWLCRELKRLPSPPAVVVCSTYPDAVLAAYCIVAEADALVSSYDCDYELCRRLGRAGSGVRLLPSVPPRVGAMLHDCLAPTEHAIFSMLRAGASASDAARGLGISHVELELRRSLMLEKLEALPPTSATRY
jgi:DNA-binding NarL/FixJ family response regulator